MNFTFSLPSFRARVKDERVLNLQFVIDNPDGQVHFAHEVGLRSLILTEAHEVRDARAAMRAATHLRTLANDLDALAHDWMPAPREPSDDAE